MSNTPVDSDGYINHCNKTKRKSNKKNWGHPFACNDRNKLKHPLLHLFRSLHGKGCPQFFWDFFVSFRFSDLYTHQNPWLLLLHSAGHRDAGLIIETPFVTFVLIVTWEKIPQFFLGLFCFVTFQYIHPSESMVTLVTYC